MRSLEALQKYFGYTEFREGQAPLIEAILENRDALGIMPTGGGKSLCYQLPALLLPGVTVVVSPLISLMKDQVDALNEIGIPATFINSTLDSETFRERASLIARQQVKIVYVAPERINSGFMRTLLSQIHISFIAVDEAHCISKWGHDFRPAYGEIVDFIYQLPYRPPVGAYTATATPTVIEEIKSLLHLQNPTESIVGFDRPNLTYEVLKVANKGEYIDRFIKKSYRNESGIIYCATRKSVNSVAEYLEKRGHSVLPYHGGMSSEEREANQNAFILDHTQIIVATNAFGMGIDKPNVRFVIHYNMPQNMEAYYQEAGRAGRDGEPGHCLLLYSPSDIAKQKFLIENSDFEIDPERKIQLYQNLQYLIDYCHTDECLRRQILLYFAENPDFTECDNCSNCTSTAPKINITIEAQKILSCIYRLEMNYGITTVIKVLRGSKEKRILELGFDKLSTYGLMKNYSEKSIREMIMTLIARGYIQQTNDERPVLRFTHKTRPLLKGEAQLFHRQDLIEHRQENYAKPEEFDYNPALFEELRALRLEIARAKDTPAYTVFNDISLKEMARDLPQSPGQFLKIKGVGTKKLDEYGERFMAVISQYLD